MNLFLAGLDYRAASIALRERLSFTRSGVLDMDQALCREKGVVGAVLLSTCNRTELYLSATEKVEPEKLLCKCAGVEYGEFAPCFSVCQDGEAVRHLMEVACGLQSQILGEDQILTQVKNAIALAREAGTATPDLEALFRNAAACGKAAKSTGRLTRLPVSAAHQAVELLKRELGSLDGRKALIIGNGEMGKLAAGLLVAAGCRVTVTLRSYRHGETVIPTGCAAAPYDARYDVMEGMDVVISATTSPHFTIDKEQFGTVSNPPRYLVDLAIPRDIQPEVADTPGVHLWNVDSLGSGEGTDAAEVQRVEALVDSYMEQFRQWLTYREGLPARQAVKDALWERLRHYVSPDMDGEEAARLAMERTVELLAGAFKEQLSAQDWHSCEEKIRSHTR